jgi:hypothetical protein
MLAELCNTKNSRYFDGKRVLNDGIHTSMVIVYSKVEAEKLQCQVSISVVRVSFRPWMRISNENFKFKLFILREKQLYCAGGHVSRA